MERDALKAAWQLEKEVLSNQFDAQSNILQASHKEHISLLAAELEGMVLKEQNTQATLFWTATQLENHKQSIQELLVEIEKIKQSTSWRLTAPLRKLLQKIS